MFKIYEVINNEFVEVEGLAYTIENADRAADQVCRMEFLNPGHKFVLIFGL